MRAKGKYLIGFSVMILLLFSCSPRHSGYTKSSPGSKPQNAGKCYAKVTFPTTYTQEDELVFEYIGDNPNQLGLQNKEVVIKPAIKEWRKKKQDNCMAPNPDDCLVWCLVDIPAKTEQYIIVKDTNQIKDFLVKTITYEYVDQMSHTDWAEVICQNKLTKSVIRNLKEALFNNGYQVSENDKIDKMTQSAITQFQKDNNLAFGALTVEFLDALDI